MASPKSLERTNCVLTALRWRSSETPTGRKKDVGWTTELRILTYHFDDESGRCWDLDKREPCRNSSQPNLQSRTILIRNVTSTHALISSLTVRLLLPSGVNYWVHRFRPYQQSDAYYYLFDGTIIVAKKIKIARLVNKDRRLHGVFWLPN